MPRCPDCSTVVVPTKYGEPSSRSWSSGPELIRLAEAGCDLCSFFRRHIESVSTANIIRIHNECRNSERIKDATAIVLQDCEEGIEIFCWDHEHDGPGMLLWMEDFWYRNDFRVEPVQLNMQASDLETSHHPILRARELLEACVLSDTGEHENCLPENMDASAKASALPRRLLDLSDQADIVTLDVQAWISMGRATIEELSKYCTLSYRWGKGAPDCMLKRDFTAEQSTSFSSMPQTFKDAIAVARALEIRFIWIDALCIIQPSAHGDFTDWNVEGPRMWLVYQNAVCTIAATCSSDPDNGFLWKVGTDLHASCSIPTQKHDGTVQSLLFRSAHSPVYRSIVASSLNRRGWVAQERLLSRRVLHFSEEGVFWECQARDVTWDKIELRFPVGWGIGSQQASFLTLSKWLKFIEFYSTSAFTQSSDRLVALSSIAKCVPIERFGNAYVAGIWCTHLTRCLAWRSENPSSAPDRASCLAIAPSWSWASVIGRINYGDIDFHSQEEEIDRYVAYKDAWVSEGFLNLRVRLGSLILPTISSDSPYLEQPVDPYVIHVNRELRWDECQDQSSAERMYDVVLIGLTKRRRYVDLLALVVIQDPPTSDKDTGETCRAYRRIGIIEWTFERAIVEEGLDEGLDAASYEPVFDKLCPGAVFKTITIV
jgi:hypothetical protein